MMRYPWHEALWSRVSAAVDEHRLPHALLLEGQRGLGKRDFAAQLGQGLLCRTPRPQLRACGECRSCRLVVAGSHPDLLHITPPDPGKAIPIDAIRALSAFFSLTPHFGKRQLALLIPADALNRNAADALLKTLEEPPAGALLLLVSERPARLPATIRSRCQTLRFAAPPAADGVAWLKDHLAGDDDLDDLLNIAGGAPLRALSLSELGYLALRDTILEELIEIAERRLHPVAAAERWSGERAAEVLSIAAAVAEDLARLHAGANVEQLSNARQDARLRRLAGRIDLHCNFRIHAKILETQHLLNGPSNLRRQDLMEEIAAGWAHQTG